MSFPSETPLRDQLCSAFPLLIVTHTSRSTQASVDVFNQIHLGHQKLSAGSAGIGRGTRALAKETGISAQTHIIFIIFLLSAFH